MTWTAPPCPCSNAVMSWVNWLRPSSTWPGACARALSNSACCYARCLTNCARRWRGCASPMTATCHRRSCASAWTVRWPTCRSCWKTPSTWRGWTPNNPACRPSRYWCFPCGKPCARTSVSKAAGTVRACRVHLALTACCRLIWTVWPRPWKTCCAMPFATRRPKAGSALMAGARAHAGTCA
ncbi:hypothetical protein D9M71_303030 [compost metagenome]